MIRAVLFDLDATLIDDGLNWRRSVTQVLERVCERYSDVDLQDLRATYYEVTGKIWDTIKDAPVSPWGNMDEEQIVQRVWGGTLRRFYISDESALQEAADAYLRFRSVGAEPYDDVESCLNRLASGYELGIVTNGLASMQQPKIEAAGLAEYFQVTATTDIGFGKPGPEIFLHALDALGVPADASVYVGDSLRWDVGGAGNAGMVSVWLNRNGIERTSDDPVPDAQITSLAELPELVARL